MCFEVSSLPLIRILYKSDVEMLKPKYTSKYRKIDLESIFRNDNDGKRLSHLWISYLTNLAHEKATYQKLIAFTNKGALISSTPSLFKKSIEMWERTQNRMIDNESALKARRRMVFRTAVRCGEAPSTCRRRASRQHSTSGSRSRRSTNPLNPSTSKWVQRGLVEVWAITDLPVF